MPPHPRQFEGRSLNGHHAFTSPGQHGCHEGSGGAPFCGKFNVDHACLPGGEVPCDRNIRDRLCLLRTPQHSEPRGSLCVINLKASRPGCRSWCVRRANHKYVSCGRAGFHFNVCTEINQGKHCALTCVVAHRYSESSLERYRALVQPIKLFPSARRCTCGEI